MKQEHENRKRLNKKYWKYILIIIFLCSCLFLQKEQSTIRIIKGILFSVILSYASFYDIEHHEIPDWVHVVLFLIGFMEWKFLPSIVGMILIAIPFLFVAFMEHGGIGGGDIKYMIASGFLLGAKAILYGSLIALTLAVILNIGKSKKNKKIAMAPYLSIGCFLAFLFY